MHWLWGLLLGRNDQGRLGGGRNNWTPESRAVTISVFLSQTKNCVAPKCIVSKIRCNKRHTSMKSNYKQLHLPQNWASLAYWHVYSLFVVFRPSFLSWIPPSWWCTSNWRTSLAGVTSRGCLYCTGPSGHTPCTQKHPQNNVFRPSKTLTQKTSIRPRIRRRGD